MKPSIKNFNVKKFTLTIITAIILFVDLCLIIFVPKADNGPVVSDFADPQYPSPFSVSSSALPRVNIDLWYNEIDTKWYLFLPASFSPEQLILDLGEYKYIIIDEGLVLNGQTTSLLTVDTEHKITLGSDNFTLIVAKTANLPQLFINTDSHSLQAIHDDKDYKEPAKATLVGSDGAVDLYDIDLKYIKGRGNSTWHIKRSKKPYNIKFKQAVEVLDMDTAKNWALIANAFDETLLKNLLTLGLGADLQLAYTPQCRPIDLWANATYRGAYLICQRIEVGEGRVEISDMDDQNNLANPGIDPELADRLSDLGTQKDGTLGFKKWVNLPNDPPDITGDYLLELEYCSRLSEIISGFETDRHRQCIDFKNPKYASYSEVSYMKNFYQEIEEALYSEDGYNSLGKHWSEYFDLESIAKMYLLEAFVADVDAGASSQFFVKKAGEDRLIAVAPWDFDYSMESACEEDCFAYEQDGFPQNLQNLKFFDLLWQHQDFRTLARQTWQENASKFRIDSQIDNLISEISRSAALNDLRWMKTESENKNTNLDAIEEEYINYASTHLYDFIEKQWNIFNDNL